MPVDASALRALAVDMRNVEQATQPMARAAVDKAAYDVEAHAKTNAPVDTGYLQNSVGVTRSGSADFARAEIGPTAEYGPHVEYGTHKMAAQPFMGPAIDVVEPSFIAAMEQIGAVIL